MSLSARNAKDLIAPWTHWFLYGESRSGKTKSASTFPRPVFLVPYNEQSITTLRGLDMPYYEITGMKGAVVNGSGGLEDVLTELETEYYKDPDAFPYETVVVESISHYSDLVADELTRGGKAFMDQAKWGQFLAHFRNVQSRLRRMDVHAVFTALSDVKTTENTTIGGPLIQGQTSKKLPSACDVIAYCEEIRAKTSIYRMHLRRYGHFAAGSRFSKLPEIIDDFDFKNIKPFIT
jgi:AAA domain